MLIRFTSQKETFASSASNTGPKQDETKIHKKQVQPRQQKTIILFWDNHKYKRTCSISNINNVASIRTTAGYSKFEMYCQQTNILATKHDSEGAMVDDDGGENEEREVPPWPTTTPKHNFEGKQSLHNVKHIHTTREEKDTRELLRIHEYFNHVPFNKIQEMA